MKSFKNLFLGLIVVLILFGILTVVVYANNAGNDWKQIVLDASRPAIGNPRGTSTVTLSNASTSGVRVRTIVMNSNTTTTTPNNWQARLGSLQQTTLPRGTSVTSTQTIGSTRAGTVRGEAYRLSALNGNWQNRLFTDRSW